LVATCGEAGDHGEDLRLTLWSIKFKPSVTQAEGYLVDWPDDGGR